MSRLSLPCLFNLYAEYIIQNARLDELQTEIKTTRRNINNLKYEDDTTLKAESEEESKNQEGKLWQTSHDSVLKGRDIILLIKVCILKATVFPVSCTDVRTGPERRLSAKELMISNCDAGEGSWDSLGQQEFHMPLLYGPNISSI